MDEISEIFSDNKKRNLILWLTDMIVAIASYFYMTRPEYLKRTIDNLDIATLRPDLDPNFVNSPEFFALMQRMVMVVAILTIALIVILHTLAFYKCYLRKKSAIAYVKIYSMMAAVSLLLWFLYNFHIRNIWILIPTAIYALVFVNEKQTNAKSVQ
ncbi:hypothetical protein CIK05_02150 [Bdellovibrio sp. qaytius]|nr:hypothetical protein CIK05_02150 [Bdellovibrio sp. qaytius]